MITGRFYSSVDPRQAVAALAKNIQNKAIRIAMNKAAALVKEAAIANAPSASGTLKKSLRIKIKNYRGNDVWAAIVGPSSAFARKRRKPSRYAHLVEFGSRFTKPTHFLSRTMMATHQRYLALLESALGEQVEKLLSRP